MVARKRIPVESKALAQCLRRSRADPLSYREIAKRCNISKSEVHRLCNSDKSKLRSQQASGRKLGRSSKIDQRGTRTLIRTIEKMRKNNVNFSVTQLAVASGLNHLASRRTFSRYLNEQGYKFLTTRKKDLLSEKDRRLRLQYARRMKRTLKDVPEFWTKDVAFYLDAVSFVHKSNPLSKATQPKSRVWRQKSEGLKVTAKGSKDLAGGKRLHVLVAISYGNSVILRQVYDSMNSKFFASFVKEQLPLCFEKAGNPTKRIFIQDNDPSQMSKAAKLALREIGADFHKIPARSPDLNAIENCFHIVKKLLEEEAIEKNIVKESFHEFKARVLGCLDSLDGNIIDKTIATMPKRINQIIACKGARIHYEKYCIYP